MHVDVFFNKSQLVSMPCLLMVSSAVVYINTECVSDGKHSHSHLATAPSWVSGVCVTTVHQRRVRPSLLWHLSPVTMTTSICCASVARIYVYVLIEY